jgi:NAD(P)-dependent dehydrogenase (short-subunit alcohol dehydrogenase family)
MTAQTQTKVALVTGASYGIGAAAAMALAQDGYDLVIADLKLDMLAQTEADLHALGRKVLKVALDVNRQDMIDAALAQTLEHFGRIDVLVNNAAVPQRKSATEVTREDWHKVMDVNLAGSFFTAQAVARHWIETKQPGTIVSVASTHGLVGLALSSVYGISKAGIIHMTRMLAIEWAEHGIRVNAIAPASTVTPTRAGLNDPEKRDLFLSRIPLARLGQPADMAQAIAYLAGDKASFITGHTLVVDGGVTVQ